MAQGSGWKTAVRVARGQSLEAARRAPAGSGRATVFDFEGTGAEKTWIGTVTLGPSGVTGAHHHGRHEVALGVTRGQVEIRWGEKLEYAANVGPGDFVYFAPYVPHQERNLSATEAVDYVVVRSDNERIAIPLDVVPVERPEKVC
jgi:uncharacterized RmlC-like cupin family protein